MAGHQNSLSWLWKDDVFADTHLHIHQCTPSGTELPQLPSLLGGSTLVTDSAGGQDGQLPSLPSIGRRDPAGREDDPPGGEAQARGGVRSGRAKAARCDSGDNATPPPQLSASQADGRRCVRTFRLHANVLAASSAYFKLMMTRASAAGGSASSSIGGGTGSNAVMTYGSAPKAVRSDSSSAPLRWVLMDIMEEGELDAVEAVLRHGYTGQLGVDEAAAPSVGVDMLWKMMTLADRWIMSQCVQHCCAELARRAPADHDVASINAALSEAPGAWTALPSFQLVKAAATERLLQLLGNAEAVCAAEYSEASDLDAQLLRLSLPSLLTLLRSDHLLARSENSILTMASMWVSASDCSGDERAQVAASLRLCQLSHTYLLEVLPQLSWPKTTARQRTDLLVFMAEPGDSLFGRKERQRHLAAATTALGPADWFSTVPRAAWPEEDVLEFFWEPTPADLQAMVECDEPLESSPRFVNGFVARLVLHFAEGGEETEEEGGAGEEEVGQEGDGPAWYLGHEMAVSVDDAVTLRCAELACACGIKESAAGDYGMEEWSGCISSNYHSYGMKLAKLPGVEELELSQWRPYVVDGKLRMKCSIVSCN